MANSNNSIEHNFDYLNILEKHWGSVEIVERRCKSLDIIVDHWEPLRDVGHSLRFIKNSLKIVEHRRATLKIIAIHIKY